jgi:dynein heavy chain
MYVVCEEVCDQPNIFADEMSLLSKVPSYKEAKQLATNRDEILILEKRVTNWIRKIREVNFKSIN